MATPDASLLDRVIAAVSPKAGFQRARYKAAMSAAASYDAASRTRRAQGMRAPAGDANVNLRGAKVMRDRARDMVRNNAIASAAARVLVDNSVGDGIIPKVRAGSDRVEREVEQIVRDFCDSTAVDARGLQNIYGLQRQSVRALVESGEMMWLERPRFGRDGLPLNFQIETLESEMLDSTEYGRVPNGNDAYDGIEFDLLGRRVAYRLYYQNPFGDYMHTRNGPLESRRVKADRVAHLFKPDRPDQRRGVPMLAPVMPLLHDAYEYADARLIQQKISAMWVAFEHDISGDIGDGSTTEDPIDDLQPGSYHRLPPGRTVEMPRPPEPHGYSEYFESLLRMVAAALGITFESLAANLRGVNYTSGRLGRLDMQRNMSALQNTVIIPMLCEPMGRWLRRYIDLRLGGGREYRIEWIPPRFPMTDPTKDVPATAASIRNGLTSRRRAVGELGLDVEQIDDEFARDLTRTDRLGITYDTDPRRNAQAPEQGIGPLNSDTDDATGGEGSKEGQE
ncbi:phage portal protein [Roseovarius sp. SYSU LYC5161]|uniref:phage portal protein n=1 Tax=Roseovarius halophilus (ex Wu et al. 2025) TaxID=3376060 RepID=UPI00399BBB9A